MSARLNFRFTASSSAHARIKAAVWEKEADNKRFYNVSFARTCLGNDKKFHDTDCFGRDDLPLGAKLANQAHSYIFARLAEPRPAVRAV